MDKQPPAGPEATHLPIRAWPEGERPAERLLCHGPGSLSDAELVAVVLRCGVRGRSALAIARDLLVRFGGVRGLLAATPERLCEAPGLGPVRVAQLHAGLELARRQLGEPCKRGETLTSPAQVGDYLAARLRDLPHEVFCCLFLDNRHRVIALEQLFRGTIDGASVHPREVVKEALRHNAAAVILAHNHPSGVAEPSQADELITRRLASALGLVDIRVLDHLVVGDGRCVSLAERGLM